MAHLHLVAANPESVSYTPISSDTIPDDSTGHGPYNEGGSHIVHGGDGTTLYMSKIDTESGSTNPLEIGPQNAPSITLGASGTTVTVPGDLVVQGTTTTVQSETVLLDDNVLLMNYNYTTAASPQEGGLAVNYDPTGTNDTAAAGGFASTSTLTTTGGSTFSAGDIIMITNADNSANNGIFEVASHTTGPNILTIDTTPQERFSGNAFVTDTGDTNAVITKVNLSVFQCDTSGDWEYGKGSTVPLSYTSFAGATSLDDAYNNSAGDTYTITVDAGPIILDHSTTDGVLKLSQGKLDDVLPALDIEYTALAYTSQVKAIEVDMTGATSFSNANDIYGVNLSMKTNGGAGEAIGLRVTGASTHGSHFDDNLRAYYGTDKDGYAHYVSGSTELQIRTKDETTNTSGSNLDLLAGAGGAGSASTAGTGGSIGITAGAGGAADTGNQAGPGGSVDLASGQGGVGSDTGNGGDGGAITLTGAAGGAAIANGADAGIGGIFTVNGGTGGAANTAAAGGVGGDISMTSGQGGSTTTSGAPGTGGGVTIFSGLGGDSQTEAGTAGQGGNFQLRAGGGGDGSVNNVNGGDGGHLYMEAGALGSGNGTGVDGTNGNVLVGAAPDGNGDPTSSQTDIVYIDSLVGLNAGSLLPIPDITLIAGTTAFDLISGADTPIQLFPNASGAATGGGQVIIGASGDDSMNQLVIYNGDNPADAAEFVMYDKNGVAHVLWVEASPGAGTPGNLRIERASVKTNDTAGTIVGTQSP